MVSLTDIGEDYYALHCFTDLTTCCRGVDGDSAGEWFLPGQTSPVVDVNAPSVGAESFTRNRGPSAVLLNRRTGVVGPTGLFICHVPGGSGMEKTLYIGVGAGTSCNLYVTKYKSYHFWTCTGVPAITDLDYDRASLTLMCISSGGPVDSVTWMKDGSLITGNSSTFSLTQTIINTISSTYHHILSSSNSSNFVGNFACIIRDAVGNSNSRTRAFNGMLCVLISMVHNYYYDMVLGIKISNDPFVVGSRAVVNCSSDSGVVDRIEWVSMEGELLVSDTSIQQLKLVLDPVRDDLHRSNFTCIVTRNNIGFNQTLSLAVRGK